MAKARSEIQAKYDKAHCKYFSLKMHLENDADIIEKFASVPSMQGYIKQLVRDDIARTRPNSVPISLSNAALSILAKKSVETGASVPDLISVMVNEQLIRTQMEETHEEKVHKKA